MPPQWNEAFDAIVIGSGFGGAVAVTKLVDERFAGKEKPRILVLERGTWWRNPEGPGLRSNKATKSEILGSWQYWPRPNDSEGLVYIANAIYKEHNPVWDLVNPFLNDNDLGVKKNRKGMFRLTRFSHENGNVDVVSGSAVGGGSLFYSGVNLIPHLPVLQRIGMDHLESGDFQKAGEWMHKFRGKINKINTRVPVPHYLPKKGEFKPEEHLQLARIPETTDPVSEVAYEMPNPTVNEKHDGDYLLLDRARVLKRAMERVERSGGFVDGNSRGEVWSDPHREPFEPLPLSVVEYDPEADSKSDKTNTFCMREGRCTLGCLPSARHTLYKTIQVRQDKGDDITVLPMTKVSHIDRDGEDYVVHFKCELDDEHAAVTRATSRYVFLAAGCLGTSEILLRSRERFSTSGGAEGLPLSPMVGRRFSTNGDFFAFTYDMARDRDTRRTVDEKDRIGNANPTLGPINSSHFYVIFDKEATNHRIDVNVEDAGIPTAFARLVHGLLPHFSNWNQFWTTATALARTLLNRDPFPITERPDPENRDQEQYLTERELLANVFFYNLMGSGPNEPMGTFSLQPDGSGLDLSYDDTRPLGDWEVFKRHESVLGQLTSSMTDDGHVPKLAPSPFWQRERRVTVVHPLGGCPIGGDSSNGAADTLGRLFDGSKPSGSTDVLPGLYVVDASAIPGALGVNPTFTIVAQAVRTVDRAMAEAAAS